MDIVATYRILDRNMETFLGRIDQLNKRASKLCVDPIVVRTIGTDTELWYYSPLDGCGECYRVNMMEGETLKQAEERVRNSNPGCSLVFEVRRYTIVEVCGKQPKLVGWSFAAVIQHLEDGNVLSYVPGFSQKVPSIYRMADPYCDHCKLRRNRKDTYVVVSDDGKWMQVGRQCLKDFIGHADPHKIAEWAELLSVLDRECVALEHYDASQKDPAKLKYFSLRNYLEIVAWCIRTRGWVSLRQARESTRPVVSTADLAMYVLAPSPADRYLVEEWANDPKRDEDRLLAEQVIEWAENLSGPVLDDDYFWNIRTIARSHLIESNQTGLAASMVRVYQKFKEKGSLQATQHVGKVGERVNLEVEVVSVRLMDTRFGKANLIKAVDSDGNILKWWSSTWVPSEGSKHLIRATIKSHDVYRDTKETTITRIVPISNKQ